MLKHIQSMGMTIITNYSLRCPKSCRRSSSWSPAHINCDIARLFRVYHTTVFVKVLPYYPIQVQSAIMGTITKPTNANGVSSSGNNIFSLSERTIIGKSTAPVGSFEVPCEMLPLRLYTLKQSEIYNPEKMYLWANSDIVTGATGGLGYSIAEALLQAGADVIAIDRNEEPINHSWGRILKQHTCDEFMLTFVVPDDLKNIAEQAGSNLTYHGCDITDADVTSSVFEKAVAGSRFPLRGIVHCAGIGWISPSIDFPIGEARKIIDVNLVGTLVCAQVAAKIIQKHNVSASFVFIASMSGYVVNKVRISRVQCEEGGSF